MVPKLLDHNNKELKHATRKATPTRMVKKPKGFGACLHEGGGPQVGKVTRGGSPRLSCKRDQIKMRDYMDR